MAETVGTLVPTTLTSETTAQSVQETTTPIVTGTFSAATASTTTTPSTTTPSTVRDSVTTPSTISTGPSTEGTTILSSATNAVSASAGSSSVSTSSSDSTFAQSTSTSNSSSAAQLSTGSIVGIAVGSIAALVLLVTFLLFAFGFRVRRAKRRSDTGTTEQNEGQDAVHGVSGAQNGKAELEDPGYTRRLERLHNGAKPELDGSKPRKTGWRAFSIRSLKRGSRPGVAELDAGTGTPGPQELPA